jgi:soluble cytochrome b562
MATTIESLFGKSPEQLEYERQQAEQQRRDDMYATTLAGVRGDMPGFATGYALGYQGGEGLGQAIQGIFGAEPAKDPALAKARKAREIFSKYGTGVFNDSTKLTQLANDYADADMLAEAMAIQQMAADLNKAQPEQFYTASGEELMAQDPFTYRGLNKDATYQVSTKTKKATELIKSKDADKETDESVLTGRQLGALNTITAIDEALELADEWGTTGFVGAVIRSFGRFADPTDAGALGRTVETIKANIGFDRLQRMRDESKTGGALGQVAVQELNALRNSVAALEPSMTREQFKKNLRKVRDQYFSAMSKVPPEVLEKYGFDPSLSGSYTRQKSIDVSGKTQSTGSSATSRFNELNR